MAERKMTVPYGEFSGTEFSAGSFLNLVLAGNPPFDGSQTSDVAYSVIFDKGRKLKVYPAKRLDFYVNVGKPAEDFVRGYVERYLAGHRLKVAVHESKYHTAKAFPSGKTSFDYIIPGSGMWKRGGVASQMLRKRSQVLETVDRWSDLAKRLGFEVHPIEELSMGEDCKAVKLCTNFREMKRREVPSYITNTLLGQRENPKSKLVITTSTSSLVIDQKGLRLSVLSRANLRKEVSSVADLIGEVNTEPRVSYKAERPSLGDQLGNFYGRNKKLLQYGLYSSIPPAFFGLLGYQTSGSVEAGFTDGVGTVVAEGILVGLVLGYKAWNKRRERKEKEQSQARDDFIEFAEKQAHLKEPYGKCVVLSTSKCVLKASKQNQSD